MYNVYIITQRLEFKSVKTRLLVLFFTTNIKKKSHVHNISFSSIFYTSIKVNGSLHGESTSLFNGLNVLHFGRF